LAVAARNSSYIVYKFSRHDVADPTEDLGWGGYIGGIHEIFHKNAVAHPDRLCVTETVTSKWVMDIPLH
jgi:hypothetical protein